MQREQQDKLMDEMFSPISGVVLPASIENRLDLYTKRNKLEDENKEYKIIKQKFLNYRQFNFKLLRDKKEVIPAYALSYSTLPRKKAQGRIEYKIDEVHYFNREEIIFITLKCYNDFFKTNLRTTQELIYNHQTYKEELRLREHITGTNIGLSPIIVTDEILDNDKLNIYMDAKVYEDTKEKLILL